MRRIGRWTAVMATVLASVLVTAFSAGIALAAGAPPYVGPAAAGGKGIARGPMPSQGFADWTVAIVLIASLLTVGVILALSRQPRDRKAPSAGTVTSSVAR